MDARIVLEEICRRRKLLLDASKGLRAHTKLPEEIFVVGKMRRDDQSSREHIFLASDRGRKLEPVLLLSGHSQQGVRSVFGQRGQRCARMNQMAERLPEHVP